MQPVVKSRCTGLDSFTFRILVSLSAISLLASPALAETVSGSVLDGETLQPIVGARITAPLSPKPITVTSDQRRQGVLLDHWGVVLGT